MKSHPIRWGLLAEIVVVVLFSACGGGGTTSGTGQGGAGGCAAGTQGCACYGNNTCNSGLDCSGGVCRSSSAGSGGAPGGAGGSGSGGTGTGSGGTGMGSAGTSGGGADAPIILTLSTNITTMTPADSLIVTAIVTDPQGIADVIGGSLNDQGTASYGAFQVSTTSGSYSLTLSWTALQAVQDITAAPGGTSRTFVAVFYDQEGHSTSKTFTIQLQCSITTNAICGGKCVDLQTDSFNCGSCGHFCGALYGDGNCSGGKCRPFAFTTTRQSCDAACAAHQGGASLVCAGTSGVAYTQYCYCATPVMVACGAVPPATCATSSGGTCYFQYTDCPCTEQ